MRQIKGLGETGANLKPSEVKKPQETSALEVKNSVPLDTDYGVEEESQE